MVDPDSILITQENKNNTLSFNEVPEFDFLIFDLEDDKEREKYFKNIEKEVRGSYEYRAMIKYLKENMNMDQCSFIQVSSRDSYHIKIEIHHYPFSLYDIVRIVYKKRCYFNEPLNIELVAKECTMLHYQLLVGLIPLSVTAHQLFHAGKLFIPVNHVLGRYKLFVDFYKKYCTDEPELFDALDRIEKYSIEQMSDLYLTSNIFNQNEIHIQNNSSEFQLPDMNNMNNVMNMRISDIKNNGYRLPSLIEEKEKSEYSDIDTKTIKPVFIFSKNE